MAETARQPNWDIDREIGEQAEVWVSDIRRAMERGSVEVKRDQKAMRTGNLYVEYECRRRGVYMPSGIETTKADAWIFVVVEDELALVIETEHLKKLCRAPGIRRAEEKDGSHPTKGYLLPVRFVVAPAVSA
ncbi:MAG: hypothetical protein U1E51_18690 [Candidatus Binatia bacterium]|nr:hypothetical protein [Candidatus Binatia bacterium]